MLKEIECFPNIIVSISLLMYTPSYLPGIALTLFAGCMVIILA